VYRFGDFTLDTATRQLLLNGAEVHLSPKAFALLAYLVTNRSRAVSKAELQEHLWPATFVEETNLASLIAEIRRALRDPAADPQFVRTVYGFGYRFVAEVRADPPPQMPPSTVDRARLFVVFEHRETLLMNDVNVIGRAPDATIRIDSPGVSRHHARVLVSGRSATLEDAESKNGTFLNGTRIMTATPLSDGDQIKVGRVVLTFRIVTPTSSTATLLVDTHESSEEPFQ
jgi:DNA-binding winged helix-turn-helix (wHTH) protein